MHIGKYFRRFGTDILGYTCLVLVIAIGPLPGPGGIPLLIAGLGLLSVHNPWAKKLLGYVRMHSQSFRTILFPDVLLIQRLWDGLALLLLPSAIYIGLRENSWFIWALSTSLATLAVVIALSNRSRLEMITKKRK
jgi:hypothetical protein